MNAIQTSQDVVRTMLSEKMNFLDKQMIKHSLIKDTLLLLQAVDLSTLVDDQSKRAFWINCYNGITNYTIITRKINGSILLHPGFFRKRSINIGGILWSLNDIEHGILRKNRHPLGSLHKQLSSRDIRYSHIVEVFDPRIHFALNCGGLSCPLIREYSARRIDNELHYAEISFLAQGLLKDPKTQRIAASRIFKWYKADFGFSYISREETRTHVITYQRYHWNVS